MRQTAHGTAHESLPPVLSNKRGMAIVKDAISLDGLTFKSQHELKKWLKERARKDIDSIFGENYKPAEFDELGAIFGDIENLDKTDAELFPDELEEHTPEERREKFKVHSNEKKKDDDK